VVGRDVVGVATARAKRAKRAEPMISKPLLAPLALGAFGNGRQTRYAEGEAFDVTPPTVRSPCRESDPCSDGVGENASHPTLSDTYPLALRGSPNKSRR